MEVRRDGKVLLLCKTLTKIGQNRGLQLQPSGILGRGTERLVRNQRQSQNFACFHPTPSVISPASPIEAFQEYLPSWPAKKTSVPQLTRLFYGQRFAGVRELASRLQAVITIVGK
jgi:hypothetical protein